MRTHFLPRAPCARANGVALISIPSSLLPTSPALTEDPLTEVIAQELDKAKGAKGVIWDVRGNPGGATFVALSIVGSMPGCARGTLAKCAERKVGVFPFAEQPGTAFPFEIRPNARFAFPGKDAVLIDGLTTSVGDYFAFAAARMTKKNVALVGAPTSGAYGSVGDAYDLGTFAPLRFTSDVVRCADATMRRCADAPMRRCDDAPMRRCADAPMRRARRPNERPSCEHSQPSSSPSISRRGATRWSRLPPRSFANQRYRRRPAYAATTALLISPHERVASFRSA